VKKSIFYGKNIDFLKKNPVNKGKITPAGLRGPWPIIKYSSMIIKANPQKVKRMIS
jgi:hypothetical protein